MKRYIVPVFFLTIVFWGFDKESKARDQLSASPPAKVLPIQQPARQSTAKPTREKDVLGDYVSFPASGVKIRQPVGFEKEDSFDGFGNAETQSSIMALSMAGPYLKVNTIFTQDLMKARGWTLRSRQNVKVNDLPGIFIHFEQPAQGQIFLKWSLIFGDDRKTTMVTATFPKSREKEMSARLKSAVQSTSQIDRTAPSAVGLPFTLVASNKLKLTQIVSKMLAYTKDGVIPSQSPKDPLFIAVPSLGKVVVLDKLQYAERLLQQTNHTKKLIVKSTKAIAIDGLNGYESLAEAEDTKSGTPLIIYQVILFNQNSYIRMLGLTGTEFRDEYLPEFKAMARSLQRKQP